MLHRVREAMQGLSANPLGGEVEVDETFIGGKARNVHEYVKAAKITGTGGVDKEIVFGIVERGGRVRTGHFETRQKKELQSSIRENIQAGSAIFSDELKSYDRLNKDYRHAVINRAVESVRGKVHTNAMELFWSLVKRQLHGTYIRVEPFHLFRYLDEQAFLYNDRQVKDKDRFELACRQIVGRRLTWDRLTGKDDESAVEGRRPRQGRGRVRLKG
jgi:transposase-like protein